MEKKKENTLALRTAEFAKLLEVSTCFCPYLQIHFRGSVILSVTTSPFSTAGFCLSRVTAKVCAPDHTEHITAGFISGEALI